MQHGSGVRIVTLALLDGALFIVGSLGRLVVSRTRDLLKKNIPKNKEKRWREKRTLPELVVVYPRKGCSICDFN